MSPISKPQLLLYLQLSQIESVYQVAQNPDIMALILSELEVVRLARAKLRNLGYVCTV